MSEFQQAIADYRRLVIDMDGDGVPDAPLQQPMQMPQPTNAMLASAGQQQPSQGGNAMRPDQVVDRGTMVPLVEYGDGSFGPGLPGFIHGPISAVNRMLTPGYDYDNVEQASRDALDASGLAITGGIGAAAMGAYPRNSIGMIGSGRGPNWLSKMVDRFVDPSQAVRRSIKGQVDEKLRDISQMVRDGRIGPEEAARQMAAIRQQHANAVDTYSQPIAAEQPTPPDRYSNRMLQGMAQSQAPQPGYPQSSSPIPASPAPPGIAGPGQVGSQRQPVPTTQTIPPASGGQTPGGGTSGGTSANPQSPQPTPSPGTSSAQTSGSPSMSGPRYTDNHSTFIQKKFEDLFGRSQGAYAAYADLDNQTKARVVSQIRDEFRRSELAVPSEKNLRKRLDGTMRALADLEASGANVRDPNTFRLAFRRADTLAIGGAPMVMGEEQSER